MKKILAISFLLSSITVFAQDSELKVDKLISEKSFVFVSTAAFSDQPVPDFWETVFGPAPMSISKMQNLEKNSTLERALQLNAYVGTSSKGVADKMSKSKTEEVEVVFLHDKNALFHPSIFQPTFYELVGKNPDSLNNPFSFDKYSARKIKKGKWAVNFNIDDDLYSRNVHLLVSPDGKTEMTIATAVKRYNDARRTKQYFKGFIKEFDSL